MTRTRTTTTYYYLSTATTDDDLRRAIDLRHYTEQHFRAAGIDQWHDTAQGERVIRDFVANRQMKLVKDECGQTAAAFAVSGPDQDFWTKTEASEGAVYLYKMMVHPHYRGVGLGDAILDHAGDMAMRSRRAWVRIDCWRTNAKLHEYYRRRGFQHVATRSAPGRNSGWLAQRPANQRSCLSPIRLEENYPTDYQADEATRIDTSEPKRGGPKL